MAVLGNMDFGIQPSIPVVGEDAVLSKELVRVYHQLQHHVVGLENATLDQIGFRVDNILTKKVGESLQGKEEDADVYLEKFTEFSKDIGGMSDVCGKRERESFGINLLLHI